MSIHISAIKSKVEHQDSAMNNITFSKHRNEIFTMSNGQTSPITMRTFSLLLLSIALLSTVFAQSPDRSKPPELGPPPALKLPAVQHFKLSNGLPVVFMEKHDLPLVQMSLVVRAGSVSNPSDKPGLASMTSDMMEEGAGSRNSLELSDAISFLGVDISSYSGTHTSGVSLHSPLSKLDDALALYGDIIMKPTFPQEELDRKKTERLTNLMQSHDQPRAIASVLFNRTLFGAKHPYGIADIGTEKSIRAMKVDDMKNYHSQYYNPANATLIVVGDLTKDAVTAKLEKVFAGWTAGKSFDEKVSNASQVSGRTIYLVDKPGAAQSVIRFGRIGVDRMTNDFFAIQVMNTILGGSFTSRLNQNLREEHGYAYGASSSFGFRPAAGPFTAASDVQTDVTDKALTEFMKELKGILEPIPDAELTRAKNYLALGYPDNFSSVASITNMLADLVIYNLPDDYFNNYISNVQAITKDDVNRVSKKYIDPDNIAIIVVGDRKKIESGIKSLNLGSIKNYSIDDVLGKAPKMDGGK